MSSKLMASRTNSMSFPSPDSPPRSEDEGGINVTKGWYSERAPRESSVSRKRYVAASALMPFSSGRALPSKWDDAQRWISSPVSVGNVPTTKGYYYQAQAKRRTKSKSGPLRPGLGYNTFSPVLGIGVVNGGEWRNSLNFDSPNSVRIQLEERLAISGGRGGCPSEGGRRSCPGQAPEWLELWSGPLYSSEKGEENFTDENIESIHDSDIQADDGEYGLDRAVSRRDMATQMFPDSGSSSPSLATSSQRSSISNYSPSPLLDEQQGNGVQPSPQYEVRDVQVDQETNSVLPNFRPQGNEVVKDSSYSTTTEEGIKLSSSNLQREEGKIKAWENLQKAKAESAIQKLEMKLEKKRASTMEKINEKLRRAEIKAQKMRSSIPDHHTDHFQSPALLKPISRIPSFCKKIKLRCVTC